MLLQFRNLKALLPLIFTAVVLFAAPVGAVDGDCYRIGFVGGLTGKNSDLGIQGRNGVSLAVEEINARGGVNGRMVELIIKDDEDDPKTALKVDRELIDEGAIAIIGHMRSAMSEAALPLVNERRVLMISPTSSTNKLTGMDDYFLRVISPNRHLTDIQAGYVFHNMKLHSLAAIYDSSHRAYAEEFIVNFKSKFERLGGKVISVDTFTAGPKGHLENLTQRVLKEKPDGILITAGPEDTVTICRHLRLTGSKIPILVSGWAQTPDLLRHGGPDVEEVIGIEYHDLNSSAAPYAAFKERFRARFGHDGPTFAAVFGYEAVTVLSEALSRNPDRQRLKQTILAQQVFPGLQGPFEIDAYGDAKREAFIVTIHWNRLSLDAE